jgi:asparagine synthase (glutamine-hydrolysing)
MPGIAGILPKQTTGDEKRKLDRMIAPMIHENFYTTGTYVSINPNIYLGYTTIKGSFSDCMPVTNEKRDLVLLLTGEFYDDPDIITGLAYRGHKFQIGDASYLIHLFEEEGNNFFGRLNGWFNGIIIDRRNGQAHLFNDRYGIRRIYYYENKEGLYFSSEAKSLLAIFPMLRSIDPASLGEYLVYDCVFENRSLFRGVNTMPPGSLWTLNNQRIEKRNHCDSRQLESQPKLSEFDFLEILEETFSTILPRYLTGHPKCLALTGGLDTRMIMAFSNAKPGDLPCLTHGGMYNDMLDVRIARKVAAASAQNHYVIPLDKRFLNNFPKLAERTIYITDGLANAFESHHLYLNNAIREIAPIKITGKYGSQIIKNISAFHRPTGYDADARLISHDFMGYLGGARSQFTQHVNGHPLSVMVFKEIPWWWCGIISVEFSQITVRSPYLDNNFVNLLYRSPFPKIDPVGFQLEAIRKRRPELYGIMTTAGYGGNVSSFLNKAQKQLYKFINLLEKAYSRDKLPLSLHHAVAWVDYHFLNPLGVNRFFMGLGDYRHYRIWARDELSDYIQEILLDQSALSRPFWNKKYIERAVSDHIKGRRNRITEIQKALSIELIHRTLIENPREKSL